MACFLAPVAAAIISTSIKKKIAPRYHIEWLSMMLWGGAVMLAVEHIARGEVIFSPPWLSAMKNSADTPAMLKEIATTGVAMTMAIAAVWSVMVFVSNRMAKIRSRKIKNCTT